MNYIFCTLTFLILLSIDFNSTTSTHLPPSVKCAPTYCTLEPGSNRVALGLKNISSRTIKIPSRTVVGKLQQAKMVPEIQKSSTKEQIKQGPNGGRRGPVFWTS